MRPVLDPGSRAEVTSIVTDGVVEPGGVSRAETRVTNCLASDSAMSSDRAGDVSVTVAVSRTVFRSPLALILLVISSGSQIELGVA